MHTRPDSTHLQTRLVVPSLGGGSRVLNRSLGTEDAVRGAKVDSALQALAEAIPSGDWQRTKRLIEDVFMAAGHPVPAITKEPLPVLRLVLPFVEDYLSRRKPPKVSAGHYKLMRRCLMEFARAHASMELSHFRGFHIQEWQDKLVAEDLSPGSVRNEISVISAMFGYAVTLGVLSSNPCAGIELPEVAAAVVKLPMGDEDFGKLVARASKDWLTASLVMRYSGLRLVDAVNVDASRVAFQGDMCLLDVTPGKTAKPVVIPLFEPLAGHLKGLGVASGPLTPSLAGRSASYLSKQFSALCDEAGIDPMIEDLPNGRKHRRISAHSLRHAFVTWLVRLGIPEALRMRMSVHLTEDSHRGYDHASGRDLYTQISPYFKA